jgi:7,8-dihydropterin-6-yl-methyl-4-(beta-D-ribofuranosyl)aminobenzene 5'-phosphate synthase
MVLESSSGNLVITGCCHSGVANTLLRVRQITGEDRCALLAGGLHLLRSDGNQIQSVLDTLGDAGVHTLLLGHCTGDAAEARLNGQDNRFQTDLLKVGGCWELALLPSGLLSLQSCS